MKELGPFPFEEITEYIDPVWGDYETTKGTFKNAVKANMTQYYVYSNTIDTYTKS